MKQKVKGYVRKGKKVSHYTRKKRKKGKGKRIGKPYLVAPMYDSNGEFIGNKVVRKKKR